MFKWIEQLFCKHEWCYIQTTVTFKYFKCRKCKKEKSELNKFH